MNKLLCDGLKICWRLVAVGIGIELVTHARQRLIDRALKVDEEDITIITERTEEKE